jgi:hypothetical protein
MVRMRPVFSDKEIERDIGDATTVSMINRKVEKEVDMMTKEEAENMAKQYAETAASKASEQAVNVALERYDSRRREDEERRKKEIEVERDALRKEDEEEREVYRKRRRRDDGEDEDTGQAISTKTVNELKNIASVFNALKEFSANPLQKKIEESVGGFAAGVVERAFSPPHQEQKKDLIDQILNSQFASGLGAGLGQRGPELVNSLTGAFGKQKTEQWINGLVTGKRGSPGGGGIENNVGGVGGIGNVGGFGEEGGEGGVKQSEVEMILALDPNNPEHISAYAQSQGGISIETARKVLMIHQDDFIGQLKTRGVDTSQYETKRGMTTGVDTGGMGKSGMGQENIGIDGMGTTNVEGYRGNSGGGSGSSGSGSGRRVSDDLMVNTPVDEDRRWTDNKELLDNEMQRTEDKIEKNKDNTDEISSYLKQLNEYVSGLKDMVEQQNNTIFNMQNELSEMKRGKGDIGGNIGGNIREDVKGDIGEDVKGDIGEDVKGDIGEDVKGDISTGPRLEDVRFEDVDDNKNKIESDTVEKDRMGDLTPDDMRNIESTTVRSSGKIRKGQ